jgi:hypothetical protein
MTSLPDWVKRGALALHKSGILFTIQSVKSARKENKIYLDPWAVGSGVRYLLSECKAATPEALPDKCLYITPQGLQLTVERCEIGLAVSDGNRKVGVQLTNQDDGSVLKAAQALARAFDGAICAE